MTEAFTRGEWVRVPDIATCWPLPQTVLDALQDLRAKNCATAWADEVERCLRELRATSQLGSDAAGRQLDRLAALTAEAGGLAAAESQGDRRNALLRTVYSLERRLTLWRSVHLLSRPTLTPVAFTAATRHADREHVDESAGRGRRGHAAGKRGALAAIPAAE